MLARVDPVVLVVIAALVAALAAAIGLAISRGRSVDSAREALRGALAGDGPLRPEDDLADGVGRLRRRAENAEFALGQRLRDLAYLADLVGVGIVRLTDSLQVEVANTAAHVFLGRPPGSMVGRTAIEALGDHRIEAVAITAREAGAATDEVAPRDGDGPTLIVRARRSPILGVWLVLQDVAELRRLQRIRAEFVDNLSHELRTPLTTIGLLTETLARDADAAGEAVPPRMRERIGKLEVEIANVSQMVAELLDLARIESGGPQLHLDDVDLGRVVGEAVERLRPLAERQGIGLRTDVAESLPPVRGEAVRLGQVVTNLVHNAIKFSASGSEVLAAVALEGEAVVVRVVDHGIGIDPDDQRRVFERFYKADRTRAHGGGTGLGLAIARHIVEGHGGEIRVESEPGQGSTFIVTIPAVLAAPAPPAPLASALPLPDGP
ncbi:MAG TPA: ATP-binding protein [Candidatus Limnocylindrales bacterium]|nr:ATP-binding protein [Candidatus Limnocylindrales bacterium]